jgi:hypothetical protein
MARGAGKILSVNIDARTVPAVSGPAPALSHMGPVLRPAIFVPASRAPPFSASL